MIREGIEYSSVTNGVSRVLLRVRYDDPTTLYYFFCDPNREIEGEIGPNFQEPKTSVGRILCLCLMAFRSTVRDQEWRNSAQSQLPLWKTSFDHTRSQIPKDLLQQIDSHSKSTSSDYGSPETSSEYQPSSPPLQSPSAGRRVSTRSCAPSETRRRTDSPESSGSDSNLAMRRKRGYSEAMSSPSVQRAARQDKAGNNRGNQARRHNAQFCTQRCLLGLRDYSGLDESCPNVVLHRQHPNDSKHSLTVKGLVRSLKAQIDEDIDRCAPIGPWESYGAPFKLNCATYGYTVVGKGTTSGLWNEVSREAEVYQVLRKAQGSAVPVFLGAIDLAKIYFLHGGGDIRHMLLMGWGGKSTATMDLIPQLSHEIHRSDAEIRSLGVIHEDIRPGNILWNEELRRALIIDFHRSTLACRPISQRPRTAKRRLCQAETRVKRLRVSSDAKCA